MYRMHGYCVGRLIFCMSMSQLSTTWIDQSQNMAICYIHFFSVLILGELLLTKSGDSYKIVTPAFTLPALIVVFKSMYRMHGYCFGRLIFCMSMSQLSTTWNDQSQNMAIYYIHFFSVVILGELLLTKTGESYKIVTPAFTLPVLLVVFKSMYRMHGYCVGRLNFCMSMSQLSTTWIDQSQNMAICYIHFFSVVILGELLLTETGESYKIVIPAFTLHALIVVFKSMYRMHGYCVGRLNFCMSMSQLSTTWIDQSQNMAICYIHFFSVVILGELLLTKTGESYKIVTPAFTLPALIVVFKSMYRMHGYCVGRLIFCMSMSQLSTTWIDQSQNMAICYIHFFSVLILGELLLTKSGDSYKIVTPAFTLPALIVVFKSMYRMHGYCFGRLIFCMSMSQLSTTWNDQSQNMAICYIHFFSVVILGELLLTKTGESYKLVTPAFSLPALIVVFKYMYRMHGYCVGRLNFCMSMSQLSTTWIDQSQNMAICYIQFFRSWSLANCYLQKLEIHIK